MEELTCPCCGNHCPKDQLQCGRGRRYFEGGANAGDPVRERHGAPERDEDKVITLLRRCGHTLHHGGDGNRMSANLTEEEKAQLTALLEKLLG